MLRMAEAKDNTGATRARFEDMFETVERAMKLAASKTNHLEASAVAEGLGLKEVPVMDPKIWTKFWPFLNGGRH
jgi:hypothetical protein